MAASVSGNELSKILGVSERAVRNAAKANRISRLPNGQFDPDKARAQWVESTDPARSRVRTTLRTSTKVRTQGPNPDGVVRTPNEAREAVSLVARVLAEEGVANDGKSVDFGKARTAELILKARQRALDQAVQEGILVDRTAAEKAFFDEARTLRDGLLTWPARIAIEAADEIRVDPRTGKVDPRSLTVVLDRYMKQHLVEMGDTDTPDWRTGR